MNELKPLTVGELAAKLAKLPQERQAFFDTEASCWGAHMVPVHDASMAHWMVEV